MASVLYAHELGLVPITTPAYSPESNGLAEGFVHTFERDYLNIHELRRPAGLGRTHLTCGVGASSLEPGGASTD